MVRHSLEAVLPAYLGFRLFVESVDLSRDRCQMRADGIRTGSQPDPRYKNLIPIGETPTEGVPEVSPEFRKSLTMHTRLAYTAMEMLEHNRIACTANHSQATLDLDLEFGDNSSARSRRLKLREIKDWIEYETDQQKMLPAWPRRRTREEGCME
eukprot:scaffold19026_cov172-Skeletonema_dohrnii-CCMP3373.AAC.1